MDEVVEGISLSHKAMQALDILKSLEGTKTGIPCNVAPNRVAVNVTAFKADLKAKYLINHRMMQDESSGSSGRAVDQRRKIGRLDDLV